MAKLGRWLIVAGLLGCSAAGTALYGLERAGITPRALAPYIAHRSQGHNPTIEALGAKAQHWLLTADRGTQALPQVFDSSLGAQPAAVSGPAGTILEVANAAALRKALAAAQPGTVITLSPGHYRLEVQPLALTRPGTEAAPVTVRAARPGTVFIGMALQEGFKVAAPYWRFENLTIQGVCARHTDCEHAFHVVGAAHHFTAHNNTILDFNAHFKINGLDGQFPDHGAIVANTLSNTAPRDTANPVTPVDLVAASHWSIRRNVISDFIKLEGDRVSYGAFVKGGGEHNVLEQNAVLCEQRLHGAGGQRIGLSLGGGGTTKAYCRDQRCIMEQSEGVIRANLVASCSDAGIYLNSAARSSVLHNTLLDTGGVLARFSSTSANVAGNLIDGPVLVQQGAQVRLDDNLTTSVMRLYAASHPQRDWFNNVRNLDLAWRVPAPRRAAAVQAPDLCGTERPATPRYGAFEDFAACRSGSAAKAN
ncbi:hypothetical protein GCM10027277_31550 [Pseudoduganella ginsengisoli]|uniref:Right-handed parallel beta-helix repeat-containing protein n=1 Tax=Pseudoduganella ginsengisoli TaxID=1462440 RepID=A0A6L6PZ76_9BURK|nr:chondroitinase-B domain-containing protein [Pseudoduganella ginsengisoli]MTW02566.1 right-handed parallel beta-helix repeat-containing protein [Pseudoduganella ginsengisoli]